MCLCVDVCMFLCGHMSSGTRQADSRGLFLWGSVNTAEKWGQGGKLKGSSAVDEFIYGKLPVQYAEHEGKHHSARIWLWARVCAGEGAGAERCAEWDSIWGADLPAINFEV